MNYNPGQNVLGHLGKLGTKTHFAKLTHILPLKTAWGWCYKGLFLLSPSPPSSVDCVELKLECITSTLHRGGRGEGRCLNLTSYCVSVPRVLTRVVGYLFPIHDQGNCLSYIWLNQESIHWATSRPLRNSLQFCYSSGGFCLLKSPVLIRELKRPRRWLERERHL